MKSSYYNEVYLRRLNRYGYDYQTRLQNQRERVFEDLLLKSIYRVDFEYNGELVPGLLERYRQDESQTLQYLLLRVNMDIPTGTILRIPNKNYLEGQSLDENNSYYWMIYYLENIKASGYNRYIVLKLTHKIVWYDREKQRQSTMAYFYGQGDNVLRNAVIGGRKGPLYEEPEMTSTIVMPTRIELKKEDYFEVRDNQRGIVEAYRVVGFDTQSNPGVEFVTVDPVYIRDKTPAPVPSLTDEEDDFYWLQGGIKNE